LSPKARATLRKQVRWLNQHPQHRVVVAGHADEDGTRHHNLALGAQRALAVKRYLKRAGLRTERIHTVSYGQERPIAACDAAACRSKNRRAQTVLSADTPARD
jgi:peptidoglycan-associated lipoprotein